MELMEGGELFNYIVESQHLSEGKAQSVFRQIVAGVAHLHSIGIAHRDLKPQNLMYCQSNQNGEEKGQIKIIDYDLARVNHSPEWEGSTPCGTMYYMAPEVVHGEAYSLGIDCWSLGVILYILLSGELPFQGPDEMHIAALIRNGRYSLQGSAWEHVSNNAKNLIRGLLEVNPGQRLTAAQCLQHPWLKESLPLSSRETGEEREGFTEGERCQQAGSTADGKLKTIENLKRLSLTREASGSLTKALDYDLESLRQEEPARKYGHSQGCVDGREIAQLKVTLDLVGKHAGLQDSLATSQSVGGSPVCSPFKSRTSHDPWHDEFDDLGASVTFVEEEITVNQGPQAKAQ